MDREAIEVRVDELRDANPGREEFISAVKSFSDTLDEEERSVLGQVLLDRKPETGGFDVVEERIERGGWIRRTVRNWEEHERRRRSS